MNHYTFEELTIGMEEKFEVIVTEQMITSFKTMSGDNNPMHMDDVYAQKEGYRERIVYGMCTASLYSTLVGVYLPGERCLIRECNVSWSLPVYVGDKLYISGKVLDKDERFQTVTVNAVIKNECGKKVSRAVLIAGVR